MDFEIDVSPMTLFTGNDDKRLKSEDEFLPEEGLELEAQHEAIVDTAGSEASPSDEDYVDVSGSSARLRGSSASWLTGLTHAGVTLPAFGRPIPTVHDSNCVSAESSSAKMDVSAARSGWFGLADLAAQTSAALPGFSSGGGETKTDQQPDEAGHEVEEDGSHDDENDEEQDDEANERKMDGDGQADVPLAGVLLRPVVLGGAAARLVSSVSHTAALLPLSQTVGAVGSLWERSSAVRSTLKAVSRLPPSTDPYFYLM